MKSTKSPRFKGLSLSLVADKYLAFRAAEGRNPASYWIISAHWIRVLGDIPIRQIDPDLIEDTVCELANQRHWSAATRALALNQLSGLMTFALRRGWIIRHPLERGRVPRPKLNNARQRWLRLEELERVLAHCPMWLKPIVRFSVATGMRAGEVVSLTGSSFQVDDRGQGYVRTSTSKNGRALAWPLEGAVRAEVERRARDAGAEGRLFPGPRGGNPRMAMTRHFRKAVEAAGLTWGRDRNGITWHTLRHSMASIAINTGVPEQVVQQMGNWRDRRMVARYAHLADDTLRAAAGHMADLLE